MKKIYLLIITLFTLNAWAQDIPMHVIAAAGGYFENASAGLSASWTVGEVVYTTLSDGNFTLTQGFQQGNLFTTSIVEPKPVSSDLVIYPNPVRDFLNIKVEAAYDAGEFLIELIDITGRRVFSENKTIEQGSPTSINLTNIRSGVYLLQVTSETRNTQRVIKLIKE